MPTVGQEKGAAAARPHRGAQFPPTATAKVWTILHFHDAARRGIALHNGQCPALIYWTAEFIRALPDDGERYEVVHGELLVTPAPRPWHQEIVGRLYFELRRYLARHAGAHVLASPADISWSDDTWFSPISSCCRRSRPVPSTGRA